MQKGSFLGVILLKKNPLRCHIKLASLPHLLAPVHVFFTLSTLQNDFNSSSITPHVDNHFPCNHFRQFINHDSIQNNQKLRILQIGLLSHIWHMTWSLLLYAALNLDLMSRITLQAPKTYGTHSCLGKDNVWWPLVPLNSCFPLDRVPSLQALLRSLPPLILSFFLLSNLSNSSI